MTTISSPTQIWNTMPGWGIVADLTPPELTASRRLAVIRKALLAGLISLVVLLLIGYGYAFRTKHVASSALAAEQARTSRLLIEQNKYGVVTQLHGSIASVDRQLATLMTGDVGFSATVGKLVGALPPTMAISDLEVKVSPAGAAAATAAMGSTVTSLDTSGHQAIGQVTVSGSSHSLDDLSGYLVKLRQIKGVIDVVPVSNQVSGPAVQFNVTLSLTDQVLTHRFDMNKVARR
jgi:type IV pilus assembly protein PilN